MSIEEKTKLLEVKANDYVVMAEGFEITNDEQNQEAADIINKMSTFRKNVKAFFKPVVDHAHKAWKVALGQQAVLVDPVEAAEKIMRQKSGDYFQEQERIRREEENRIRREAEKKAKREREEEVKKERERAEKEAAEAKTKKEKEAIERKAKQEIEATLAAPIIFSVPTTNVKKVQGLSARKGYDFEIVDAKKIPRLYMKIDETKIRKYVKMMGKDAVIDGVRVFEKTTVATQSKASNETPF